MGEVVLKIRPVSTNRKSKAKIMYGDIDGIYTVFIHNTTDLNPPPTDDGECVIRNGQQLCSVPMSVPIVAQSNRIQSGGIQVCNLDNSPPHIPDTFDLNASLKKAEEFKSKMSQIDSTINSYGDVFERKSISGLKTAIKYTWAVNLMNDGQPLDLKAHFGIGTEFEDIGNFHYAAFLKAAGFETTEILSGASTNQA